MADLSDEEISEELDRAFAAVRKAGDKRAMLVWLSGWALGLASRLDPAAEIPQICTVKAHQEQTQ